MKYKFYHGVDMSDTASSAASAAGPESQGTAEAILATVRSFHPGATVSKASGRSRPLLYRAVPDLARPRLLVPGTSRRSAAKALLRFSSALTLKEAVSRLGAAAATQVLGPAAVFSEGVAVTSGAVSDLSNHLSQQLGVPVSFGLGIGTARANRKPILAVFDARGRNLAYAKIGDSPIARERVIAEADALREIDGWTSAAFEVPRLISLSRWEGHEVLLLSALDTRPQNPRRFWEIPLEHMREFSRAFGSSRAPLAATPGWQSMMAAPLATHPLADRWMDLADRLAEATAGDRGLPVGAWHGDWTGWNMAWRRRKLQLWDFERFEKGVPEGLDAFHFPVNAMTLRRGLTEENVVHGLRVGLNALGDDRGNRTVAGYYLAAVTFRYLESLGQDGERLVLDRISVMLMALSTWLAEMVT